MSQIIEFAKYSWDHKSQIADGAFYLVTAGASWKAIRFLGTTDVAPNRVCVTQNRFTGSTRSLVNSYGEPRTGMILKLPWERRIQIPIGDETIDILEVGSDGEEQQIQLRYPDGQPSAGWKFDGEISYSLNPQFADELVRQLGSEVNPRIKLSQEMIRIAKIVGFEALNGQSVSILEEPGGLERFADLATAQFKKRLEQREWGEAVKFNYMAFSSPRFPKEYTDRLEETQRLALQEAKNQLEARRIQMLGPDGVQQALLANAGRVFVFQQAGRGARGEQPSAPERYAGNVQVIPDGEIDPRISAIVNALKAPADDDETTIMELEKTIRRFTQQGPIVDAISGLATE